jgi:hypothetical protein
MSPEMHQLAPFHQQAQDIADFLALERAREASARKQLDDRPLPSEPLQSD